MKKLLIIFSLLAMSTFAIAEERMHLIRPKGTELKLVQLQRKDDLSAKFSGQVWVTGTFVGRWPAGAKNKAYKTPEYLLVPNAESIAKLPHFVLKDAQHFSSYRVRTISLQNGEAALRIAVSEEEANQLLQRKVNATRTTGDFLIESYTVGVECDAPWARASLVRFETPERLAIAHLNVPEGC